MKNSQSVEVEISEGLEINSKDLHCPACKKRYDLTTKQPRIFECEHTICYSCCKKEMENNKVLFCPLCRKEILKNPTKNLLVISLLERDSRVTKCPDHRRPFSHYCEAEEKLLCSQCELKPDLIPLKRIEAKLKDLKGQKVEIETKKGAIKSEYFKKVQEGTERLKRRIDEVYDENFAFVLGFQKKLIQVADKCEFTEKQLNEHQFLTQCLTECEKEIEKLEVWDNKQEPSVAAQILNASFKTEEVIQVYTQKKEIIERNFADRNQKVQGALLEFQSQLEESFKDFSKKISHQLIQASKLELDSNYETELARNHLLKTFEEYGLIAKYQAKEDCIELTKSVTAAVLKKFYPKSFECSIEKLNLSCYEISDSFELLWKILQHTKNLSNVTLSLKKPSSNQIKLISNLIRMSNPFNKFALEIIGPADPQENLKEYVENLLSSSKASGFNIKSSPDSLFIAFQQSQVDETVNPLEDFSAEFAKTGPLFDLVCPIMSSCLASTKSLKKLKISFGEKICYQEFVKSIGSVLQQNSQIQELDLRFTGIDLFIDKINFYDLGQRICQAIVSLNQLTKVNLLLAGNDISDFYGFFPNGPGVSTEHKLEEFSLTLTGCQFIYIENIINYLKKFPRLKNLGLKLNRPQNIQFKQISELLKTMDELKSLKSLDFVCLGFPELTKRERKELKICKLLLLDEEIEANIVVEELNSQQLINSANIGSKKDQERKEYMQIEEEHESEEKHEQNEEEEDREDRIEDQILID